jgi:hypothetical protein
MAHALLLFAQGFKMNDNIKAEGHENEQNKNNSNPLTKPDFSN